MKSTTNVAHALGPKSNACARNPRSRKGTPGVNGRAILVALVLVLFGVLEVLFMSTGTIRQDEERIRPPRLEGAADATETAPTTDEVSATEAGVSISPVLTR